MPSRKGKQGFLIPTQPPATLTCPRAPAPRLAGPFSSEAFPFFSRSSVQLVVMEGQGEGERFLAKKLILVTQLAWNTGIPRSGDSSFNIERQCSGLKDPKRAKERLKRIAIRLGVREQTPACLRYPSRNPRQLSGTEALNHIRRLQIRLPDDISLPCSPLADLGIHLAGMNVNISPCTK
ncbi:hypothetical protein CIHG_09237 [Coccidioides immitis H538.4]|uniref:Uncharacterized protein n=3 Tax=Coccidioides immitis TaxID=5501 RepID=A0A0J8R5D2_COCIT|nr:hypothetical protein CIRG_07771 [Coccidioides immitis RMSCC 2394]KMU79625.1 hypothetical protein CISG_02043 [Coccidioides immitis RMSCC 3703]KMU91485.1 hypothetical protein CIHG_09237 [Coccidioides immitis H538.4]